MSNYFGKSDASKQGVPGDSPGRQFEEEDEIKELAMTINQEDFNKTLRQIMAGGHGGANKMVFLGEEGQGSDGVENEESDEFGDEGVDMLGDDIEEEIFQKDDIGESDDDDEFEIKDSPNDYFQTDFPMKKGKARGKQFKKPFSKPSFRQPTSSKSKEQPKEEIPDRPPTNYVTLKISFTSQRTPKIAGGMKLFSGKKKEKKLKEKAG